MERKKEKEELAVKTRRGERREGKGEDGVSESLNATSPTGGGAPTKTSSDLQIPDR